MDTSNDPSLPAPDPGDPVIPLLPTVTGGGDDDDDDLTRNPKRARGEASDNPLVTQHEINTRYTLNQTNGTTGPMYNSEAQYLWPLPEDIVIPAELGINFTEINETINFLADTMESAQNVSDAYFNASKGKPVFGTVDQRIAFLDVLILTTEAFFTSTFGAYISETWPTLQYVNVFNHWLVSISFALATPSAQLMINQLRAAVVHRNPPRRLAGHDSHYLTFDSHMLEDWLAQGDIGYGGSSGNGAFASEDSLGCYWSTDREVAIFLRENKFHIDLLTPFKIHMTVDPGSGNAVVGFRSVGSGGISDINFYSSGTEDGVSGVRLPRLYNTQIPTQHLTYNAGHYLQSDVYLFSGAQTIEIEVTHPGVYANSALVSYRTTSAWDGGVRELGSELLEFGSFDTSIEITDIRLYDGVKLYYFDLF
jgi:hypothetical protein